MSWDCERNNYHSSLLWVSYVMIASNSIPKIMWIAKFTEYDFVN